MSGHVCRVCLDGIITMYCIVRNTELGEFFDKIAPRTPNQDRRSEVLCYICYAELKRCCRFARLCEKSGQFLTTLVNQGIELTNENIEMLDYGNGMKKKYSINELLPTVLPPPTPQYTPVQLKTEYIDVEENTIIEDHEIDNLEETQNSNQEFEDTKMIYISKPYTDLPGITNIELNDQTNKNKEKLKQNGFYVKVNNTSAIKDIQIDAKDMLEEQDFCFEEKEVQSSKEVLIIDKKKIKKVSNYVCKHCSEIFTNKKKLLIHERTHITKPSKNKDLYCSECSKTFTQGQYFSRHMQQHVVGRAHICHVCKKGFFIKPNLDRHMRIHTRVKPYVCDICSNSFNQKVHLKNHMKRHDGNRMVRLRMPINQKPICDYCNITFRNKKTISRHIKIHEEIICKICNIGIQKCNMKKHMITHRKEVCHVCGKVFKKRRQLNMHIKIHNKCHFCPICNFAFATSTALKAHMTKHTKQKAHTCNICDKNFSLKSTLYTHMKTHMDEKQFTCDDCGRTFSQKICLIKHTRVHTGIKPYACDKCDRRFTQKNSLNAHLKSHQRK